METPSEFASRLENRLIHDRDETHTTAWELMIKARDAVLRRECADRAIEWLEENDLTIQRNIRPSGRSSVAKATEDRLRAIIERGQ